MQYSTVKTEAKYSFLITKKRMWLFSWHIFMGIALYFWCFEHGEYLEGESSRNACNNVWKCAARFLVVYEEGSHCQTWNWMCLMLLNLPFMILGIKVWKINCRNTMFTISDRFPVETSIVIRYGYVLFYEYWKSRLYFCHIPAIALKSAFNINSNKLIWHQYCRSGWHQWKHWLSKRI